MKNYPATNIRNVVFLGHGRSGKTALAEAMLFNAKAIDRLGKAVDGNTTMDFDPEEIKRQASLNTSIAAIEWSDHKINLIDTPGEFDYVGEVMQGLRVADAAVIVAAAKAAVSVGTEKGAQYVKNRNLPAFFYVSKVDEPNASFTKAVEELQAEFGNSVTAFVVPLVENEKITGFVDVVNNKAYKDSLGKEEIPVPADIQDEISAIFENIKEHVAESDEELMEKYFDGEDFTEEEIRRGLKAAVLSGSLKPVFGGSSTANEGIQYLMDAINGYFPSPIEKDDFEAELLNGDKITLKSTADETLSALVFKTIVDPFVGKISVFKVFSGTLKANSTVYNSDKEKDERVAGLFNLRGKKQISVDSVSVGDIGAVAKLNLTNTNDTLTEKSKPVVIEKIKFPVPCLTMAILPVTQGEEDKIAAGLTRLAEEDPSFIFANNAETRQLTVSGVGEQHIDVLRSKLRDKFHVESTVEAPRVAYRETIRKSVEVQGRHKKQSDGSGQFGDVGIKFEPGETTELTFEEKIFGGSVPKSYHPAVEKGLLDAIQKGVLAGYPVVNLKATLYDGSYHEVDSNEISFRMAARLAYRAGLPQANPILLEPISTVKVYIPEAYLGDVMGDMNKRRGRIMGIDPEIDQQVVTAEVPTAEMASYATDLRSMTQGRGWYTIEFARYEPAPMNIAEKVIAETKARMEEEED